MVDKNIIFEKSHLVLTNRNYNINTEHLDIKKYKDLWINYFLTHSKPLSRGIPVWVLEGYYYYIITEIARKFSFWIWPLLLVHLPNTWKCILSWNTYILSWFNMAKMVQNMIWCPRKNSWNLLRNKSKTLPRWSTIYNSIINQYQENQSHQTW